MSENINVVPLRQPNEVDDPLTNILRSGARQLLAQAVEMEAEAFLLAMKGLKLPDGRDRLVRHGHGPERTIQTGIGPVEDERVKIWGSRGGLKMASGSASPQRFFRCGRRGGRRAWTRFCRCSTCGAFRRATSRRRWRHFWARTHRTCHLAVISRLTAEWQGEYERWQKRDLSARRYVSQAGRGFLLPGRSAN